MQFVKMQATGNDFVVVEPSASGDRDWSALAKDVCDRHFGIGSDGILLVRPSESGGFRMQMFNPDGSESEMCGNGIRCVTKYAVERGLASANGGIPVETLAGLMTVWPVVESNGVVSAVRVDMLPPELTPARIPVAVEGHGPVIDHPLEIDGHALSLTFVSMGNPHAVAFLDTPVADFPLERVGPLMEAHPLYPKRINFEIVNVVSRDLLRIRVWERGAGLTMACGTGACAAFVAAHLKGLVGDAVTAELPGGDLHLEWNGQGGSVYMTGPVHTVFTGELTD